MKQYFVMKFEKGAWHEMSFPAPTLKDADTIAKNILAVKKGVAKVSVISRNEAGKLLQTHREYSKNPAKKKVIKRVATKAKKNPDIHIDINSHNAKKSAKAKTNPTPPKSFNICVQYQMDTSKWNDFAYFDSELTAKYVAQEMAKNKKWLATAWRVVRI